MANWSDPRIAGAPLGAAAGTQSAAYDAGLRSYMLSVYNYMASGVLLTGIVALLFARSGYAQSIMMSPGILKYVIMFAPLGFVFALSFGINRMSTAAAQATYWAYAAVMGMSLSTIFLIYTGTSIAQTFFATAGAFAGLSLFGYTTKKDMSGFGTFFAGLTAYDTQKIKSMYSYVAGSEMVGKSVVMGALQLYLDFINMFMFLLRLFGSRD